MRAENKIEYQEVGQLFRQYTNFLTSIMQHFIAGNGLFFIGLAYASKDVNHPTFTLFLITLLGFLGSLGTLIIQIRTFNYWNALLERGIDLEENANGLYSAMKNAGKKFKLRSAYCAFFIYSVFSIFWFVVLLKVIGVTSITISL